jgi:hypothetical protein
MMAHIASSSAVETTAVQSLCENIDVEVVAFLKVEVVPFIIRKTLFGDASLRCLAKLGSCSS